MIKKIIPLFDFHTHFRTPGFTHKEDLVSGAMAALKGGYQGVLMMPNTLPAIDSLENIRQLNSADRIDDFDYLISAALTKNQNGNELVNFHELQTFGGVHAFTDDGKALLDEKLCVQAMLSSRDLSIIIMQHLEDIAYKRICGRKEEYKLLERDLNLIRMLEKNACNIDTNKKNNICKRKKIHYHAQHISLLESVELIFQAKKDGLDVTAEVTPHHLIISDDMIDHLDPYTKVNPPIRTRSDCNALIDGLNSGVIDMIATDHAPHAFSDKENIRYEDARPGFSTIEVAFSWCYTELVLKQKINFDKLVEAFAINPRKRLGIDIPDISKSYVLFDSFDRDSNTQGKIETLERTNFISKGKNFPFASVHLKGEFIKSVKKDKVIWEKQK